MYAVLWSALITFHFLFFLNTDTNSVVVWSLWCQRKRQKLNYDNHCNRQVGQTILVCYFSYSQAIAGYIHREVRRKEKKLTRKRGITEVSLPMSVRGLLLMLIKTLSYHGICNCFELHGCHWCIFLRFAIDEQLNVKYLNSDN